MGFVVRLLVGLIARFKSLSLAEKVGLITGGMSLTDTIITKIVGNDLKAEVYRVVVEEVARKSGLELDPSDPFGDASMAGALSNKIGIPIRSLKDRQLIKEDLENYALNVVSEKSGYTLHSVTDVAVLRADMQRIGLALASDRLGIPLGVLQEDGGEFDAAAVRERLLTWAKAELMAGNEFRVAERLQELAAVEGVEELAAQLNGRLAAIGSAEMVTSQQIAVQLLGRMSADAVADFGRVAKTMSKRSRRQELNRAAQAKFRAAHGNRQRYVPLGMDVTIG